MDKIWRRMEKEARLHLDRKGAVPLDTGVTDWLDLDLRTTESTALATLAMHRQRRLPWPVRKGFIASEYCATKDTRVLLLYLRLPSHVGFASALSAELSRVDVDATDMIEVVTVTYTSQAITIVPACHALFHATAGNEMAKTLCARAHAGVSPLRHFVPKAPPVWASTPVNPDKSLQEQLQYVDMASGVLSGLANLAVPCGYRLKRHDRTGFGTNKQRRTTRGQTTTWHCHWNRVHELAKRTDHPMASYNGPVAGHWKTQWRRDAGFYACEAPKDPVERQRLKDALHVGEVYCPPFWMGPKLIETPDAVYEACLDEVQLSCWLEEKAAIEAAVHG